ncbi:hypothetical protein UCRPC4_g03680 [Phaeomoniella chlamydospora]|uniref:Uncharacterized protein n=1 Tax=Phaeomoniella chlamydospora TaxID=158046 RepID=A0A0G2EEX7_PHACM|nr:hypothetical protein UCRPC4_g03680 [Phaeomoniella chlamydospora]
MKQRRISNFYKHRSSKDHFPILAQKLVRTSLPRGTSRNVTLYRLLSLIAIKINCRHRNYAGLRPKTIPGIGHAGAPVANGLHLHGQFIQFQDEEQTADLRAQMKEWKKHNDIAKEGVAKGESDAPSNRTIFVLDFGLWDIWQAVALDPENARYIVTTSVDMIFEALDVLDQIKGEDRPASDGTKAILPLVLDMTFLPGFAKDGETTKTTLELIQLWNGLLTERAKNWSKGDLFLYDTNAFLVEHIRARQIVSVDRLEEGRQDEIKAAFANVNGSCIGSLNGTTHNDKHQEACDTPDDFLFWDEVHFTPKAHQLIAQEIKRDIETLSSGWV